MALMSIVAVLSFISTFTPLVMLFLLSMPVMPSTTVPPRLSTPSTSFAARLAIVAITSGAKVILPPCISIASMEMLSSVAIMHASFKYLFYYYNRFCLFCIDNDQDFAV